VIIKVQEPDIKQAQDAMDRPGTVYLIDTLKKEATITDLEGNQTKYFANENYVVTRIVADGIETYYTLDANYNVLTENTSGSIGTNTYDSNGNLLTTIDTEGNTQTYTYTDYGNVKTYTDSKGKTITYMYDSKGDLKMIEIPDNNADGGKLVTELDYDEFGDIQSAIHPDGSTQFHTIDYVKSAKTVTSFDIFGNSTFLETDFNGNVLEEKDGNNKIYSYIYNSKNEIEQVTDPKLGVTEYGFDDNGNVNLILNARNFESEYLYNKEGVLTEETNEIGQTTIYKYDSNGNLNEILLPSHKKIIKSYDELDRVTEVYSNDSLIWKFNYEGDKLLSVNHLTDLYKSFTYNENNLKNSIREGNNLLEYSYNEEQNISQVKYTIGSASPLVLDYSLLDGLKTQEIKRNGESLANFQYKTNGLIEKISYANESFISIQYENERISEYSINNYSDQVLDDYTYEYDANNNIKKITSRDGITEYEYDELNQLITEKLPNGNLLSYEYDEVGNRKKKSIIKNGVTSEINYEYNGSNQLMKVGSQNYQYDTNGNLIFDGNESFIFNDFNQLEEIKDVNGSTIVRFTYDEEGKRISKKTSEGTILYYYDRDRVLYETDSENKVLREYTYDDKGHPLTLTKNGNTYYYLFNYRGDVIALTDLNGNVVASYSYDAWGNILTQSGSMATENPYRYAGYRYDENTKLYYLMARYYNPDKGVFLTHDPVRGELDNPITLNGYNYANNNPVMNIDPSGMIFETLLDLASIGYSTYQLIKNPTWKTAGYLIWDIAATAIPVVPGSYVLKGGKLLVNIQKGKEVFLPGMSSFEQARNMAFKIMEKEGKIRLWNSVPRYGRLGASYAFGKVDGRMAPDGSWLWRVDYDPKKGAHINIIIGKKNPYKIVIPFKATQKQYKSIIDSYNKR
jgi:RHS repeat-associated protein